METLIQWTISSTGLPGLNVTICISFRNVATTTWPKCQNYDYSTRKLSALTTVVPFKHSFQPSSNVEPSDHEAKGLFIFNVTWVYFEGEIPTLLHTESIDDSGCYSPSHPLDQVVSFPTFWTRIRKDSTFHLALSKEDAVLRGMGLYSLLF